MCPKATSVQSLSLIIENISFKSNIQTVRYLIISIRHANRSEKNYPLECIWKINNASLSRPRTAYRGCNSYCDAVRDKTNVSL